jgi:hypothetical protein
MPTSAADLQSSLERHNATFEALLTLIPPKYYIVNDSPDNQASIFLTFVFCENLDLFSTSSQGSSKYQINSKKQKAPKQAVKEATKKAKRDKVNFQANESWVRAWPDISFSL